MSSKITTYVRKLLRQSGSYRVTLPPAVLEESELEADDNQKVAIKAAEDGGIKIQPQDNDE